MIYTYRYACTYISSHTHGHMHTHVFMYITVDATIGRARRRMPGCPDAPDRGQASEKLGTSMLAIMLLTPSVRNQDVFKIRDPQKLALEDLGREHLGRSTCRTCMSVKS